MSRWTKNIVVPLDSLCKEKENTNRPTVARSVGTVGKWGKMGFTSTRTYAIAAAAMAQSPSTTATTPSGDDELSPSVPDPPKPKKFFKSRNSAPPEVIAQMIQQLPRTSHSPTRDAGGYYLSTPVLGREPIKLKFPKSNSAERKKKSPKTPKPVKPKSDTSADDASTSGKNAPEPKSKKKKEPKELKPEAPPSRVTARARKAVNYCEDDEDERAATPLRDILFPKGTMAEKESESPPVVPMELPPPAAPAVTTPIYAGATPPASAKTPEHPPIVLRISKGTSRLISTDSSEEPNAIVSPPQNDTEELTKSRHTSTEEVPTAVATATPAPKIIVKPPKPPSPEPPPPAYTSLLHDNNGEPAEFNYCTVKISPDKPPKERLKLIIKTDFIRNAMAAAAAADKAAANEASATADNDYERPEKEKKQKNKKHKHLKHATVEQPMAATQSAGLVNSEFKTPSPHLVLGATGELQQGSASARTVISPPALSERDFDSQSSVLGSISSKGNSTPQTLPQVVQEDNCVAPSRGSSVITSDLETSQHSSLVAPPSDIESRLESMMMDGEVSQRSANLVEDEPLQEDILAVLRGDESLLEPANTMSVVTNGAPSEQPLPEEPVKVQEPDQENPAEALESGRRVTRGRGRGASKAITPVEEVSDVTSQKAQAIPRTRGKRPNSTVPQIAQEAPTPKRITRRGTKRLEETTSETPPLEIEESATKGSPSEAETAPPVDTSTEEPQTSLELPAAPLPMKRGGRMTRNVSNNNNLNSSNNNNNINKIVANLSAKAEVAKVITSTETTTTLATPRSYGRKRKNQQVTQVLQPSAEELEEHHNPPPAKLSSIDLPEEHAAAVTAPALSNESAVLHPEDTTSMRPNSTTPPSPPRRDYRIKDKFKRTLMLDNQVNCNAVVASPSNSIPAESATVASMEDEQRGSVKLVISKKKGSIFKSRALVPSDQSDQAATKRHLYKHRWDAELNGGVASEETSTPAKTNDAQTPSTTARTNTTSDDIYDDFNEDISAAPHQRDSSPSFGKLTRVTKPAPQSILNSPFDIEDDPGVTGGDTITSVKVDRKAKDFYTVVRNVKTAHQIQEIGEYQEMENDVEYILDALQPRNPISTRCLSALQLATKCMTPAFRMHVRAHSIVTKFFKALSDANRDLSLGLCTSAIMFILSQEGLNMDLDSDSLELMMNLLKSEGKVALSDRGAYERNKQKVRELCEEFKAQGKAAHLNVESITVGTLAMETLLSLTSKRAGEWFKEELRELGGLEHIIQTICDCCQPILDSSSTTPPAPISWTQALLDNVQTVERCMRVLENVTQMNEENQKYVLTYGQGVAVNKLCLLYSLCNRELMLHPTNEYSTKENPGIIVRQLLIPVMKVLINLTHTFNLAQPLGAELLGKRINVIETCFCLLLQAPNYIPDRCVFELSILVLLLLINLTMHTLPNRHLIMNALAPTDPHTRLQQPAVQSVMEYFYKCEELARLVEKNTDAILDNTDKNKKKQEELDETVNNLLQKAGHHMEHTLKGSYAGILIGHLITDSEENEAVIRTHLRGNSFKEIVSVLEKYYTFMNLTASSEASIVAHIKSTKKLIDYFKKRDLIYESNDDSALPLNLETHHSTSAEPTTSTQRVYKTYSQR